MLLLPALLAFSAAEACESFGRPLQILLLPWDGADNVPTDTAIRAWSSAYGYASGAEPPDARVILTRDDGVDVPGTVTRDPTEVVFVPSGPLSPGRTYTAAFDGVYSTFVVGDRTARTLDEEPSGLELRVHEQVFPDDPCAPFGPRSTWRELSGQVGEDPSDDERLNDRPLVLVSMAEGDAEPADDPTFTLDFGPVYRDAEPWWRVADHLPPVQCLKLQAEDAAGRRTGWGDTVCVDVNIEKSGCDTNGGRAGFPALFAAPLVVATRGRRRHPC